MFIGQEVEKEIKALGLSPKSVQLTWFFDEVKRFHTTACKYLQKYFAAQTKSEIDRYVTDDDIKDEIDKDCGFEQFWEDVGNLTEGGAGWLRYEVLPRFALAMGTKHSATGDV